MKRNSHPAVEAATVAPSQYIQVDRGAMDTVFVAPKWLRDVGFTSWFIVGAALVLCAVIGLLAMTSTIVMPVLVAGIVACVASPLVGWLHARRVPRAAGAILVLLLIVAIVAFVCYAVVAGLLSNSSEINGALKSAMTRMTDWLSAHGVDAGQAQKTNNTVSSSTSDSAKTLLSGIADSIKMVSGVAIFLAFLFLSLVFLLKDGPMIRGWVEQRMGVPQPVARVITGRVISSMRGYFFGVTIVAAFNAIVIGLSAWFFNVPLIPAIMVVTFVGAYIPYLGAWAAGFFTVLIALSTGSETAVIGMIVMTLLANGILQQLIQPIAYGAALGIHPLAVLIVTIGAGCIFGGIGLILGAPITSAIVRISADLGNAKAGEDDGDAQAAAPDDPLPVPTG